MGSRFWVMLSCLQQLVWQESATKGAKETGAGSLRPHPEQRALDQPGKPHCPVAPWRMGWRGPQVGVPPG